MGSAFSDEIRANAPELLVRAAALMDHHAGRTAFAGPRERDGNPTDPYLRDSVEQMRDDAKALRKYAKIMCAHPPESTMSGEEDGYSQRRECAICGERWNVGEIATVSRG